MYAFDKLASICIFFLSIVDPGTLEKFSQLSYVLANTQDVRNFCLRCGVFINNAKENYASQMLNEFAEWKVSTRVWIATYIIGIGADMPNQRKLICLQNKFHVLTDELENRVIGRCNRERIGRLIFVESEKEGNRTLMTNKERYISMENASFMCNALLTDELYNASVEKEIYPV